MKKLFILLLSLSLLLCGCSKEEPEVEESPAPDASLMATPEPTPTPTPEPTPTPTPEPTPDPIRSPLTGEEIEEEFTSRPFAVMMNNISLALPQCEISKADILYEILAEGGITRFMAIFPSMDGVEALGSLRSLRPYYLSTAISYDAIMVHAGGSEQAYSDLSTKGVDNLDGVRGSYGAEIFYRDSARLSSGYALEHTLFTTGERIMQAMEIQGYRDELTPGFDFGLSFSENPAPSEWDSANSFVINYGTKTSSFTYDSAADSYSMVQYGKDFVDGSNNAKLAFNNIIVISADTVQLDDYGRLGITLTGSGTGYIYRSGKTAPITWSRSADGEPFIYRLSDGAPLSLTVGKTFISVIPTDKGTVTNS